MDIDLELFCVKITQREVRRTVTKMALGQQARSGRPSRRTAGGRGLRYVLHAWVYWTRMRLEQPRPVTR